MMRFLSTALVADEPQAIYSVNVLSQLVLSRLSKESARHVGSRSDYESSVGTRRARSGT
jgi:hypothetical protein